LDNLTLKFLGACGEVTGSCVMLEGKDRKIIFDCGLKQGAETIYKIPFDGSIDYCLLSHAHLDHCGLLPLLMKENRIKNRIFSTPATKEVALILLLDAAKLQKEELEESGKPVVFSEENVTRLVPIWDTYDYNQKFNIDGLEVKFLDAGHILGSASILMNIRGRYLLYTGDLGTRLTRLMRRPQIPQEDIDYLIIESTYGNRVHNDSIDEFKETVSEVLNKGGKVLIPAFAIGRAQEVLLTLKSLKIEGYPIYLDSPMAEKVTDLTDYFYPYLKKEYEKYVEKKGTLFDLENLSFVRTNKTSMAIADKKEPMIVLAASGMLNGGRVINHLPKVFRDENSALLFIGYQANGTLGRKILDGERRVSLPQGDYEIICRINKLDGFSAHADRDELSKFVDELRFLPYQIFLIHGEEEARRSLAGKLSNSKLRINLPKPKEEYNILGYAPGAAIKIGFEPQFVKFEDMEVYPFTGAIIKQAEKVEVINVEQYVEILRKRDEVMRESLGEVVVKSKLVTELKEEIPEINEAEFYDRLWDLRKEELLSKKKLQEFINELEKGQESALAWIQLVVSKGRFVAGGSALKNEKVGNVLKQGIKSLGTHAIAIAEKVWEES